jgi:hypothetical protein
LNQPGEAENPNGVTQKKTKSKNRKAQAPQAHESAPAQEAFALQGLSFALGEGLGEAVGSARERRWSATFAIATKRAGTRRGGVPASTPDRADARFAGRAGESYNSARE